MSDRKHPDNPHHRDRDDRHGDHDLHQRQTLSVDEGE
jgi:hypothetical protein